MTCSRLIATLALSGAAVIVSHPLATPRYSPWSEPINLGSPINSPFIETGATLSKHGSSLYFTSDRPCDAADAVPDPNLWVARRSSPDGPWGEPECLRINADARAAGDVAYQDREPELSRDQHWLFFESNRPGSLGPVGQLQGGDIWVSWRPNIFDDQGWTDPVPVAGLNTASREGTPQYFENDEQTPQLFFGSTRGGNFDIWVVDILNGIAAGVARRIDEVNTGLFEAGGAVTHDGLEMFLFRGPAPFDIYTSTRSDLSAPWSPPVNLGAPVSTAANDQVPKISPDRTMLLFASNRAGSVPTPAGSPSIDIWVATRTWGGQR